MNLYMISIEYEKHGQIVGRTVTYYGKDEYEVSETVKNNFYNCTILKIYLLTLIYEKPQ